MTKKVAVVLSGCGFLDGAELHESVTTLLHLSKSGAQALCFAPDIKQSAVTDHYTKEMLPESRNVLAESGRIARADIKPLNELRAETADAVIFPGGFGAAMNLCDFGARGVDCTVTPEVARVLTAFHTAKKPIGLICIAPVLGARVLGSHGISLTIGSDPVTAQKLVAMGAKHVDKGATEIHLDETNRIVSTPAYMLAKSIAEVDAGVSRLVAQILKMA